MMNFKKIIVRILMLKVQEMKKSNKNVMKQVMILELLIRQKLKKYSMKFLKIIVDKHDFRTADSAKAEKILNEIFKDNSRQAYTSYRNTSHNENSKLKKIAYEVFDSIVKDVNSLNLTTFHEDSTDTTYYDFTVISAKNGEKPLVVKTKVLASYFSRLIGEDPMFLSTFAKRWKTYYYYVDDSLMFKKQQIRNAVNTFKEVGFSLQFLEITSTANFTKPYVKFVASDQSSSYVGCCLPKENTIDLMPEAKFGTILHEMMHSLGFHHEHQRPDRTRFLYFDSSQVEYNETTRHNVYLIECPLIGPYDADSITNYHTIGNDYGFKAIKNDFGKRGANLSELDKKKLKFVYGNNHCTYDGFGDIHYPQSFYECITCWGENSCYGSCIYCAERDHKGHKLNYHDYKKILKDGGGFFCDCGIMKHKQSCTRISTGLAYKRQAMYLCLTCFNYEEYIKNNDFKLPGVCYACSLRCHNTHDIRFLNYSEAFFCDCGLSYCNGRCYIQNT
ncbi:hypothetical protein SteCoe_34730 [Stentor coeruleus]|uniref:Metalloendopeptidase n=1 Tax=Stentor coeruleus TaxID=5963 RepID=A0A1R2ATX6_9CILI|nr:hypothetical protein SteCoe_34730 [Stentor coeruleus]